jgi:4a-hydroxytetrahydrobiopterin dehydratase
VGPTAYTGILDSAEPDWIPAGCPQRNRIHIDVWVPHDQAEARIAAAITAGGHLVTDQYAPAWWVLADAEGNEACVATTTSRD